MFNRIKAMAVKELYHILRDHRTLVVIFLMPVMMVVLYGHALNMDIKHIPVGIVDRDHSAESRAVIRALSASDYFDITAYFDTIEHIETLFKTRKIKAAFVIPNGFGNDRTEKPVSHIQLLVDGSDPTYGNASVNYANALLSGLALSAPGAKTLVPVDFRDRYLYNPDLKGANFIIPGLVAVIMMMVCALLTSITISREKETGTMDILLVSPVRPYEIIIGKVIPYVMLSLLDAVFILIFAKIVFGIPLRGDLPLLLGLSILFVYCALSIGLLISSIAPTQQVAMMAALVATILPSIVLSGFIFPIFSMPLPIRAITSIVPAKYFMIIIRGILLKSSTFDMLRVNALALFLLGTTFLLVATSRFKTRKH